jgi:hypothetical protein
VISPDNLYVMNLNCLHEDMFRTGNSTTLTFPEERGIEKDCLTYVDADGIRMIVANRNGYSCFNYITEAMKKSKYVWRIRKGTPLPPEIILVKDVTPGKKEGHYMLTAAKNIPWKKYLGILEEIGNDRSKSVKLSLEEIKNG